MACAATGSHLMHRAPQSAPTWYSTPCTCGRPPSLPAGRPCPRPRRWRRPRRFCWADYQPLPVARCPRPRRGARWGDSLIAGRLESAPNDRGPASVWTAEFPLAVVAALPHREVGTRGAARLGACPSASRLRGSLPHRGRCGRSPPPLRPPPPRSFPPHWLPVAPSRCHATSLRRRQ